MCWAFTINAYKPSTTHEAYDNLDEGTPVDIHDQDDAHIHGLRTSKNLP